MTAIIQGATYPFRAFAYLLRNPRMWGFVAIPIVLNIVLAVTLYAGLLVAGFGAIDQLIADSNWSVALEWLLGLLLGAGLLLATGFLLVRFGVVLGSPWYSKLSEYIERERTGQAPPAEPLTPGGIARDLGRAMAFEGKKLLLVLVVGTILLLLNFIPVAGQIVSTIGGITLGAFIACLDFFDGPLERRRFRFREKLAAVRQSLPASLTFGLVCFGLVSIPFVNLLSIPVCVAAGTLFFCDYVHQRAVSVAPRVIEQPRVETR